MALTDEIESFPPKILWRVLLIVYTGSIFYLSVKPLPESVPLGGFAHLDKIVHVIEFVIFSLLFLLSFGTDNLLSTIGSAFIASLTAGGLIELSQTLVTTRTAGWLDWLADIFGIVVVILGWIYLSTRWNLTETEKEADQ